MKKQKILDLRPTQFAVGMLEVDEKLKIAQKYSRKELKKFVKDTAVPIVISPTNEMYVMDHHHFLCVCLQLGIKKVRVVVVRDLSKSKMSYQKFWKWMSKSRSFYPYCQFGEGPRKPLYLPKDIRGLADDPYRSIAWFVRKAGAFENSDRNFAEFQWANFFRAHRLLDNFGPGGMEQALIKASRLAQSPKARDLPGYDEIHKKKQIKVEKKLKKKAAAI